MRLAHLSDTHLGYEAYRAVSANGENQRGVDIARAFVRVCDDIREWDPPLVVHSGDLAERPSVSVRLILLARQHIRKLASIRPDGTRRQVVIIAGNHDLPAQRREACYLELFRDIPGVHIVCDNYTRIEFSGDDIPDELRNVDIHAIPHDALKDMAFEKTFDEVQPTPGKLSVLVAHGVAGGSGLYRRVLGREFSIPTDVLVRDWAYGALGHWHRQGPVGVAGAASSCWYAGSSENMGFGDLLDNGSQRGYLRVTIEPSTPPQVTPLNLPIRQLFRLPAIDGAGKTPEEIETALRNNIEAAQKKGELAGAVVGQNVQNTPREIWALVDATKLRALAMSNALHYEISVIPVPRVTNDEQVVPSRGGDDVMRVLQERSKLIVNDRERQGAVRVAEEMLKRHLVHTVSESDAGDDSDVLVLPGMDISSDTTVNEVQS